MMNDFGAIGLSGVLSARSRNPTILVIEDESELSGLLKDELSTLGYKVILAADGAEGLSKIQEFEPDIVICDRTMPQMSGSELLERLRGSYPQYKSMPFIFLTARTDPRDREEVLPFEPFAYMEKPLNFSLLQKTLQQALNNI
jgi:CheY-like chemotaxis protein